MGEALPTWLTDPGRRLRHHWRRPTVRLGLVTYAGSQTGLLFWWVAFYPGLMSYDSVLYVWQVSTGNWSTNHSMLYTGLVWLSLRATGGVALLSLAQTFALATGAAYAVTGLAMLRASGRWLAGVAILMTLLPVVGTFSVYISKDVGFAICQVWLVGTVARVVALQAPARRARPGAEPGEPSRSLVEAATLGTTMNRLLVSLFAELALLGLFRSNGFLTVALATAGLAAVLAGLRWRVVACGLAAVAFSGLANGVVFPALGAHTPGSELVYGTAYADIAVAFKNRPNTFNAADRALMAQVSPLADWSGGANCYAADSTLGIYHPEFDVAAARERRAELFELWLRVLKRTPDEVVQARICRGSIAWNIMPGPHEPFSWLSKIPIAGVSRYYGFDPDRLAQSPYRDAVRSAPLNDAAHRLAVWLRRLSDTRSFEWFAWRGATYAYLAYLAVGLWAWRRRDVAGLALVAIVAANQLSVLVNNPAQLVRYMAGPLVVGILLLPLGFVPRRRLADEPPVAA